MIMTAETINRTKKPAPKEDPRKLKKEDNAPAEKDPRRPASAISTEASRNASKAAARGTAGKIEEELERNAGNMIKTRSIEAATRTVSTALGKILG